MHIPIRFLSCLVGVTALWLSSAKVADRLEAAAHPAITRADTKAPDKTRKLQVFILLGQSNMYGMGQIEPEMKDGTLQHAVRTEKKYPHLVSPDGNWAVCRNVRYVQVMMRRDEMAVLHNEQMSVKGKTIGPELGVGHFVGDALAAPVMLLKSCIGNRSLGWDLLPPGSKGFEFTEKEKKTGKEAVYTYAGYKESPMRWEKGAEPQKIGWYAGKQYEDDIANAKKVLAELDTYNPAANEYEIAGFFWWQGDKDRYDAGLANHYEQNLVRLIEQLRKDFDAPKAKFVLATLGQTKKGDWGNDGLILDAQLAVDGNNGRYPKFKGNVSTVYSHPLSHGGASNNHYGGNAETYMDIGEAMGTAMVYLLKNRE